MGWNMARIHISGCPPPAPPMLLRRVFTSLSHPAFSAPHPRAALPAALHARRSRFGFCIGRCPCPSMALSYMAADAGKPSYAPLPPPTADKAELFRALEASLVYAFSSEPLTPPSSPVIIVISGPSGVGKDAVIKRKDSIYTRSRSVRESSIIALCQLDEDLDFAEPVEADKSFLFVLKRLQEVREGMHLVVTSTSRAKGQAKLMEKIITLSQKKTFFQ